MQPFIVGSLVVAAVAAPVPGPETNDTDILHAIGVMIELKLKPSDVTEVITGTWQRKGQPLSCVYFKRGGTKRVAIAALGQTKVVAADGKEQATLCYPGRRMTDPVKYFAPTYLDPPRGAAKKP